MKLNNRRIINNIANRCQNVACELQNIINDYMQNRSIKNSKNYIAATQRLINNSPDKQDLVITDLDKYLSSINSGVVYGVFSYLQDGHIKEKHGLSKEFDSPIRLSPGLLEELVGINGSRHSHMFIPMNEELMRYALLKEAQFSEETGLYANLELGLGFFDHNQIADLGPAKAECSLAVRPRSYFKKKLEKEYDDNPFTAPML